MHARLRDPSLVALMLAISNVGAAQAQSEGMQPAAPAAEQSANEARFDISEYRVLGNQSLEAIAIERSLFPFLGAGKTIDSVEQARQALERTYRDAGFGTIFVDIPEQDIVDGVVRLKVTEGRLDRVRVSGARFYSNSRIRERLRSLEPGTVPHLPSLQADLNALNRVSQDRAVTPVLKAGRTPGTVDLELRVQDELPLHGSLEANDRYTADTSRTRLNLNLSYENLFQSNHSFSLQYQTAPEEPKEARVIGATYLARLGDSENLLALYAVDTDSDVAALGTLSVIGKGQIFGARFIAPLPAGEHLFHSMTLGSDYKDFDENVTLSTASGQQTPISYVSWSALYNGSIASNHTATGFSLGATFGMRRGNNSPQEFDDKRVLSEANFFYLRGSAQHERPLFGGLRLFVRAGAQFTDQPLVSNEQFAIGGVDSVRGYLEAEQLGDYGIHGTLELRSPSIAAALGNDMQKLFFFGFLDAGVLRMVDPLSSQDSQFDLSSFGVGLRFAALEGLDASLDWAYTLVPGSRTLDEEDRIHFAVRYGF